MADVELYLIIGAGLLLALVLSEAIERLGEPGFLGEILTGVVFGPSLLMLVNPRQGTPFELFALLGGVLLFFDVGYEQIDLDDLLKAGRPALIIGLSGIFLPFATGVALGFEFGYRLEASLYLGLILGVTSISIVVRTLMSLERLDTEYGRWILGASVVDDVIGLLSISLLPSFSSAARRRRRSKRSASRSRSSSSPRSSTASSSVGSRGSSHARRRVRRISWASWDCSSCSATPPRRSGSRRRSAR